MLGPVKDGGYIVANTAPGCWGPMLTPAIRGGHEVTQPVLVEGAEVGDAIAIRIKALRVTSKGTSSGSDVMLGGRFLGDPFVAGQCPGCGELYPETRVLGIGPDAILCAKCGVPAAPFAFGNGYTMVFDETGSVGITLNEKSAQKVVKEAGEFMCVPECGRFWDN